MTETENHQPLAAALARRGYDQLTAVQTEMMREDLAGMDMLVSAQTGSGKTVGFGLALAPTLLDEHGSLGPAQTPLALIIAPTRELALQVKREFEWLYADAGARIASTVGGMDMREERRTLDRGAHIVVATPGRLVDHIKRGSLDMSAIRAVVLDEADEMLDLGFREDLEYILSEAPEGRQTLMFSATVPRAIADLSKTFLKSDAVRVSTTSGQTQHADIEYRALAVAPGDEERAIINVLRYYEAQNAIVFANTRAMLARLTAGFSKRGFSVVALSGELSQQERTHALQAMRDGRARVCVATDVAARGIDLPNLELVIHAELPSNSETLQHRSGRTGRAGRKGVSALIVTPRSRAKAERLLKFAKITSEWGTAPSADEVRAKDEDRLLNDPVWSEPVQEDEADFITRLTQQHSAEQIAAAYMKLYRERHSAPEELGDVTAAPPRKERAPFGPSKWIKVSVGANDRAEARWLLPMLCRAGDITRESIGAIRILESESLVELKQEAMAGFLAALGPQAQLEEGAKITVMDQAPDLGSMPRPAPAPRGKPSEGKPHRGSTGRPAPRNARSDDRDGPAPATARAPRKPREDKPRDASPASEAKAQSYNPDTGAPAGVAMPKSREEKAAEGVSSYKTRAPKEPGKFSKAYEGKGDKPKGKPFKSGDKPFGKSGDKPFGKSGDKPAGKPYGKSDGAKTYGKPNSKPGDKPAGKPYGKSDGAKPYGKPGDKPAGKPFGKPAGKPGAKPYGNPEGAGAEGGAKPKFKYGASNTSARLGPNGKPVKPGAPRTKGPGKGPNAVPKRKP